MSPNTVRLRPAFNLGGLTVRALASRTYGQIIRHETFDRAAAVAFYAMLSLPPFLSLLLATAVGGQEDLGESLRAVARQTLPSTTSAFVEAQVTEIQARCPV